MHSSSNIVGTTHPLYTWSPWRQQSNNFARSANNDRMEFLHPFADHCQHATLPTLLVQQCCTWLHAIAHALVGFLARSISRKVLSICCREPKGTVHTCANTPDFFLLAICYVKELECILFAVLFVSQWGKIEKST